MDTAASLGLPQQVFRAAPSTPTPGAANVIRNGFAAVEPRLRRGAIRRVYSKYVSPIRPGYLHPHPRARLWACAATVWLLHGVPGTAQVPVNPPIPDPLPEAPQRPPVVSSLGTVAGEVVDSDGAMVAGAQVTCRTPGVTRQATSDINGHFTLGDLPPGPFTLSVQLPGFTPGTEAGSLQPGQTLDLPPTVLAMAVVQIDVNAITPEQAALEELHTEEHQRLVGVLPNFFVSYNWTAQPLTNRQKFSLSTHNVLDPGNLALSGVVAGVQQADNAFPGYGQGAAGYGKRFGADLANLVVGTYMGGAVLPSLFHQDPRFFYKGTGTRRSRLLYALSRSVITRGDNGHDQPNFSGILGDLSAGAISNIYYPASDRQGATLFLENGLLGIAGDAMNDIVQEFIFNHVTTRGKKKTVEANPVAP